MGASHGCYVAMSLLPLHAVLCNRQVLQLADGTHAGPLLWTAKAAAHCSQVVYTTATTKEGFIHQSDSQAPYPQVAACVALPNLPDLCKLTLSQPPRDHVLTVSITPERLALTEQLRHLAAICTSAGLAQQVACSKLGWYDHDQHCCYCRSWHVPS